MSDEIKFTCQECGKEFDPDPDTMLEEHLGAECVECDSAGLATDGNLITGEELAAMTDGELREIGLTPEGRERLFAGEDVVTGGVCICKECQDRMEAEQYPK